MELNRHYNDQLVEGKILTQGSETMDKIPQVAAEVTTSLPCFGLSVSRRQAVDLAAIYLRLRPSKAADSLAESLLGVPELEWNVDDEPSIRRLVMLSLIEHLDGLYFVETLEHDGPATGA